MQSECKSMYDASWGRDSSWGWNGAGASSGEWNCADASNWNWHSANDDKLPQADEQEQPQPVEQPQPQPVEQPQAAVGNGWRPWVAVAPETPPMPKWSVMGPAIPQIQPLVMTPETPEPRSQEEASVDKGVGKGV
jgi:hypothetical protein